MKRIVASVILVLTMSLGGCQEKTANNQIYVFSQPGCIHCEHARSYMQRYYQGYAIKEMNIHEGNNMSQLLRYAKKYHIAQQDLGTPLIAMGDNYIMGWGDEQQKKFNRYAKDFKPIN